MFDNTLFPLTCSKCGKDGEILNVNAWSKQFIHFWNKSIFCNGATKAQFNSGFVHCNEEGYEVLSL